MSAEPQLFRINPENHESEKITEVEFSQLGFQERRDIQEWIAANPDILDDGLLIIGKEFSGFDRTNERLDLLAVDLDGKLVIIELKRDHTGADAHWQAIKYASYIYRANTEDIIPMLARHEKISEEDAADKLLEHLNADDLNGLNNDQRIILASHRFAPEVTSAALWLNEKCSSEELITCIQLIPYHDKKNDLLYIQANTIIPMPGAEDYSVGIGDGLNTSRENNRDQSDFVFKRRRTIQSRETDEVTYFLKNVASLAIDRLPDRVRPDMKSMWARGRPTHRYYQLWYSRSPWRRKLMYYQISLYPIPADEANLPQWRTELSFGCKKRDLRKLDYSDSQLESLENALQGSDIQKRQIDFSSDKGRFSMTVALSAGHSLDDTLANLISDHIKLLIEEVTPIVDEFEDSLGNEDDAP